MLGRGTTHENLPARIGVRPCEMIREHRAQVSASVNWALCAIGMCRYWEGHEGQYCGWRRKSALRHEEHGLAIY